METDARRNLAVFAIAAVGSVGVFLVPWFAPLPSMPILSDSYGLGFANWAASAVLLLTACTLIVVCARTTSTPIPGPLRTPGSPRDHLWSGIVLVVLIAVSLLVGVGLAWVTRGVAYNESKYFLDRMAQVAAGYRPYVDFNYGYALVGLYGPVWLWRLFGSQGLTPLDAYIVVYCILAVCSPWMLYVVARRLTLGDRQSAWILACVGGVAVVQSSLGIQYLMIRYLTPAVALIALDAWFASASCKGRLGPIVGVLLALAGLAVTLLLASPEMAMAYLAATVGYLSTVGRTRRRLAVLTGALLACCLLPALAGGRAYFSLVASFASGGYNFPVLPGLPAVVYVIAVLTVAILLPGVLRASVAGKRPLIVGLVVLGAALVPAAFGRADWGHILFNGLVVFVMAAALLAVRRPRLFVPFLLVVAASFGSANYVFLTQFSGQSLLKSVAEARTLSDGQFAFLERVLQLPRISQTDYAAPRPVRDPEALDLYSAIATPFGLSAPDSSVSFELAAEGRLALEPLVAPGFTQSDLEEAIAALSRADCLLIPGGLTTTVEAATPANTPTSYWIARPHPVTYTSLTLFPLGLYERRPQPNLLGELTLYIHQKFRRTGTWGEYATFVRRDATP